MTLSVELCREGKKKRQHYIFSATLMLDHAKPQRLMKKKFRRANIKDAQQKLQVGFQ
jgi:hypothetical protein